MPKIENVIDTTENCRYCLMCRHVCPVGFVTAKETLTPHGWGLTVASHRRGLVEWNPDTVGVMYSCADCGTCRAHCVTDQPLPAAIAATRAEIAAEGLAPEIVYQLKEKMEQFGSPYADAAPAGGGGQTGDAALFVGDEAYYNAPETVEAALKLLKAAGVEPVLVGVGRNNGYLASSLGFPELATSLAEATLDEIAQAGAKTVFVLSPGDLFAFVKMWEERLGIEWPEDVNVVEVIPFLASKLAAGEIAFKRGEAGGPPWAYLDPSHTVRVPERVDAPRALLGAVMPMGFKEVYWRRERAHPTGNNALQWTQPHISRHLTYARLGGAAEAGARRVITEDPGGLAQLRRYAPTFHLEVAGLYELLAEHIA